jgi:type I restriction enzyme R subunit
MITDRVDLDGQLYKNFLRTEIITEEESAQPKNSEEIKGRFKNK